jgi:putative CocE/NonD family hydrolase
LNETPRSVQRRSPRRARFRRRGFLIGLAGFGLTATCTLAAVASSPSRAGQAGSGTEWVRESRYITVRDGTRLAADIIRPVRNGAVETEPLPVIWMLHRYLRASLVLGKLKTVVDELPWLRTLLANNYIIVAVDARGSGASFGTDRGIQAPAAVADTYDVTEWLAAQPWSDGNIGMVGRSYMGQAQFIAASTRPPHLRAIFPEMAAFDSYADIVGGGIPRVGFLPAVALLMTLIDQGHGAVPVDDDPDGKLLAEAVKDHQQNTYGIAAGTSLPFRDSQIDDSGELPWIVGSPHALLSEINRSNIPIYHLAGWYDLLDGDALLWYANVDNPQKILIGPWYHDDSLSSYDGSEHLRWFDHWLKGIDNGVMTGPPITYLTIGAPAGQEWRTTQDWPLPNTQPTPFYLRAGPTGTIKSAYDGLLGPQPPMEPLAWDAYKVDYDVTSGQASRWAFPSSPGQPRKGDITALDRMGLTYTSEPLTSDTEITGYPVVHLWITATATDGDFFAFLQVVDDTGTSRPISDGALRASHRALAKPPYENFGLPYHSDSQADVAPLPPTPTELVFSLTSTSFLVKAGHRVRLTITGADKGSAQTPELSPAPTINVLRSVDYASYVTLPIIPPR